MVRAEPNPRTPVYRSSPETDAEILRAYMLQRTGNRQALNTVARKLGWTKDAVVRRGAQLGVTRIKELPWSPDEERILEESGHLTAAAIQTRLVQAGYRRSCAAVQVKLVRLRIKRNLDGYSANALARAFGVDVHKVISWIGRGLLEAARRGTARTGRQGGDTWWITHQAVKRFVYRAPEEIDLARVEKFWFLDLLTDGRICR